MSIFTSFVTEVLAVPGEDGQTITIRRLAPKALERARDAGKERANAEMRLLRDSLGEEFEKFRAEVAKNVAEGANTAPSDPLTGYDRTTLIAEGVTAWSFDRPLSAEAFEDIDDETQTWLANAVLKLSKPSLYAASAEVAQKEA